MMMTIFTIVSSKASSTGKPPIHTFQSENLKCNSSLPRFRKQGLGKQNITKPVN